MRHLIAITTMLLVAACAPAGTPEPKLSPETVDMLNKMAKAQASTPECSKVWIVGHTLPKNYTGCRNGDTIDAMATWECNDGRGDFTGYDDRFFARLGGKIEAGDSDSPAYRADFWDNCKSQ